MLEPHLGHGARDGHRLRRIEGARGPGRDVAEAAGPGADVRRRVPGLLLEALTPVRAARLLADPCGARAYASALQLVEAREPHLTLSDPRRNAGLAGEQKHSPGTMIGFVGDPPPSENLRRGGLGRRAAGIGTDTDAEGETFLPVTGETTGLGPSDLSFLARASAFSASDVTTIWTSVTLPPRPRAPSPGRERTPSSVATVARGASSTIFGSSMGPERSSGTNSVFGAFVADSTGVAVSKPMGASVGSQRHPVTPGLPFRASAPKCPTVPELKPRGGGGGIRRGAGLHAEKGRRDPSAARRRGRSGSCPVSEPR